jgi:hypothetical protein
MPSAATQVGVCHKFTYDWAPDASATTPVGWAGVEWQYPVNNWGTQVGYGIPAGATKVTFYAKGAVGGEVVTFAAGGGSTACSSLCCDTAGGSTMETLTTTWTQYSFPITGTYTGGVIAGFVWTAAASSQIGGEAGAATSMTIYIDDIEWTQ